MIGSVMLLPNQPVLSIVNVLPWRSSRRSLLARARAATSAIARLRPAIDQLVDVVDDRHDETVVDGHGDAHVDAALGQQALVGPVGVEGRVALERLDDGLDHERDVAEARALPRLEVPLVRSRGGGRGARRRLRPGRRRAAPAAPGSSGWRCPCASGSSGRGLRRRPRGRSTCWPGIPRADGAGGGRRRGRGRARGLGPGRAAGAEAGGRGATVAAAAEAGADAGAARLRPTGRRGGSGRSPAVRSDATRRNSSRPRG